MNKYLLGIALGLGTIGTTYASIVSRGFLDEQLANYATTTALDLKANQSDLTNVSNIVGDFPIEIDYNDLVGVSDFYPNISQNNPFPASNISEFLIENFTNPRSSYFTMLIDAIMYGYCLDEHCFETTIGLSEISSDYGTVQKTLTNPFTDFYKLLSTGGQIDEKKVYSLSVLTESVDKIGTLPDGYETVGAALTAINAKVDNKIENLSETASAGKYVLTAVKVGDQTTYAWELIDRSESEATTTTTTE